MTNNQKGSKIVFLQCILIRSKRNAFIYSSFFAQWKMYIRLFHNACGEK